MSYKYICNPPTFRVMTCRSLPSSSNLQVLLSSFLSSFLLFFLSSAPPTLGGRFTSPITPS